MVRDSARSSQAAGGAMHAPSALIPATAVRIIPPLDDSTVWREFGA